MKLRYIWEWIVHTAIKEAEKCQNDVPIGCVIKKNGVIIVATHNEVDKKTDIIAHAEILAIKKAQKILKTSKLVGCEMYVTLEPCPMCAWAIIQSGISSVYFGAYNAKYGALESVLKLHLLANSKLKVYGGIEEKICQELLNNFFKRIRNDY